MEESEKKYSQNQHEDGRAGKHLKEQVKNARLEARIAIFCAIIMILSIFYRFVDPGIGSFVFDLMWPTMLLSIVILWYRVIFGYDPLTLMAIAAAYIALLGFSFGEKYVMFCALMALFMLLVLKVFVFFFIPGFDCDKNPAVYVSVSILLPVLMFTLLFLNKTRVNMWLSQRFEYFEENGISGNMVNTEEREPIFRPQTSEGISNSAPWLEK